MNPEQIYEWWLSKHSRQLIEFITLAIQFEELNKEELVIKRQSLLLDYLDNSESSLVHYLFATVPDFFERLYKAVYITP